MTDDKNIFGGKNPHGLYTPLSEDEQEVLERLALAGQYKIVVVDWGHVDKPNVRFGDARLEFTWNMLFSKPAAPVPVYYFTLELWTHSGIFLLRNKLPCTVNGKPLQVAAGIEVQLAWDIQLQQIDPAVVRAIKPGAHGLTTRLGNMKMTTEQKRQLQALRQGEAAVRQADAAQIANLDKKASGGR